MIHASPRPHVYVIGAYKPNGGTWMAYHLGRILHMCWHYPIIAVTVDGETPERSVFDYTPVFPSIPLTELETCVTERDILICNPSFSDHALGLRLPCRKISYVQGYTTFSFLDRFFDHYVAVSDFVRAFLEQTYDLTVETIPPFISLPDIDIPAWESRPRGSVVVSAKAPPLLLGELQERLRVLLKARSPQTEAAIDWDHSVMHQSTPLPHRDFCHKMARARYCLNLTPGEGFGLIPLEAMALGTVVLGFDGFGGRHYFLRGENSLVRRYPDLAGVADDLIALLGDEALSAHLSEGGRRTAADYGYDRFQDAWVAAFARMLGPPQQ